MKEELLSRAGRFPGAQIMHRVTCPLALCGGEGSVFLFDNVLLPRGEGLDWTFQVATGILACLELLQRRV